MLIALDLSTLCLECADRLIQLGLEMQRTARLQLIENVRFNDHLGRAAAIWHVTDELLLEGWWSSEHPRHAMVRNASRGRGTRYSRLCAMQLAGRLRDVK